jgi:hypothetical protein
VEALNVPVETGVTFGVIVVAVLIADVRTEVIIIIQATKKCT